MIRALTLLTLASTLSFAAELPADLKAAKAAYEKIVLPSNEQGEYFLSISQHTLGQKEDLGRFALSSVFSNIYFISIDGVRMENLQWRDNAVKTITGMLFSDTDTPFFCYALKKGEKFCREETAQLLKAFEKTAAYVVQAHGDNYGSGAETTVLLKSIEDEASREVLRVTFDLFHEI